MNVDRLNQLRIPTDQKRRPGRPVWLIYTGVAVTLAIVAYFAWPGSGEKRRVRVSQAMRDAGATASSSPASSAPAAKPAAAPAGSDAVLTVSGYIVNRERIEISPRFQGVVKWIGVKKGDPVKADQVVVLLDDAEQQARLLESQGHLAAARAALERAEVDYKRIKGLTAKRVESEQIEEQSRISVDSARANVKQAEGAYALAATALEWTIIRSPIDGVVLEKLASPGELVVPQSFGGTRGPSTALLAVADLTDLQVEIDVNEADLPKVFMDQKCHVSPEAYKDKIYQGYVAEIAPEANRQKGTLQIKVQIVHPDRFLTPELSARVDFLRGELRAAEAAAK